MVTESDITIILTRADWESKDGTTRKDKLYGYELYKGYPTAAINGWRITKDPKFKFPRLSLSFSGSDKTRKDPIDDNFAMIKDTEYDTGTKYQVFFHKSDGEMYKGYKPILFDKLTLLMGGWLSQGEKVPTKFDGDADIIILKFDQYKFDNSTNKDQYTLVDLKSDLTIEELEAMKAEQFPYFDSFIEPIKETEYYARNIGQ